MYIDWTIENVGKHLKKRRVGGRASSRQDSRLVLVLIMWRTHEAEILRMSPQPNELSFDARPHFHLLAESGDFLVELVKSKIAGNYLGKKNTNQFVEFFCNLLISLVVSL